MKSLFSALSATVFYPLVALVLPGLTAVSAWFVYFVQSPRVLGLVGRNHSETALFLMLLGIFVGTLIDDLGMRMESEYLDPRRDQRTGGMHCQEWWAYLRKPFVTEPSGRRHLRRLVARLKFELGVPIGFVLTCPGLWLNTMVTLQSAIALSLLGTAVAAYLLFEAAATHEALGQLRHELLKNDSAAHVFVPRKTVQSA